MKTIYLCDKITGECGFLVLDKGSISQAIQVCLKLNADNRDREFSGLIDALKTYKLTEGTIVTLSQADKFVVDDFTINVVPGFEFLK